MTVTESPAKAAVGISLSEQLLKYLNNNTSMKS